MRKTIFILAALSALVLSSGVAGAWGAIGHKTIVIIAENHLTPRAKENIKKFYPGRMAEEASWADKHRRDAEYKFTGAWHCMGMNEDFRYDPSIRIGVSGGDCITGLQHIDYCLSNADVLNLSDSTKIFNLRMLIHVVGDMHCLCHCYQYPRDNKWKCEFGGETKTYHSFVDHFPDILYEGMTEEKIARKLDRLTPEEAEEAVKGSFFDWANDCCDRSRIIYEINPYGTYILNPETPELLRKDIEKAFVLAGYRLAFLLNKYFDN